MKFILSLFFACFSFSAALELSHEETEYLKDKEALIVSNMDGFPPFNFYENKTPKGYSIDYMKLLGEHIGIKIRFISSKPWNEYLSMLENNKIDIIPHIAVTQQREKLFEFTDFNHIEYTIGMAVNKNNKIESMKDLKDKIIAVTNNSFLHLYLKKRFPNYSLLLTSSTAKAIEAVSLGQAHAVIGSLPALHYYIQKDWLSNVKTIVIKDFGRSTKTALPMAVAKGNFVLKSILEKAHEEISHSEVSQIKEKWMNLQKEESTKNSLTANEIAYLEEKKVIKMCVLPDWLPFEQIDENGEHKGIGNDIIKIISQYINTPIQLVITEKWAQSLQNIRNRKCDILPVAMDVPSRRDSMNFTQPYVREPFVIATKLDKFFIKYSEELSHKKVGVVKDYVFIDVLKAKNPNIEVVDVSNTQEGLARVSSGELFGYIDTMPTIAYGIQKYSKYDLKIAGKLEFDILLSIASRNDEPILNTIMQKSLNTISKKEKQKIVGKWIEIKVSQEFDYMLLWKISGVFLLIVFVILYKNRSVKIINRQLEKANFSIKEQQKMVNKYVLLVSTDTKGIITEVNDAYCNATGYTQKELVGYAHSQVMNNSSLNKEVFEQLWSDINCDKSWVGEISNYSKDQEKIIFDVTIEPIFEKGKKIGYKSIYSDITDKKRIEELSVTDALTKLYNRMKLDQTIVISVEKYKRHQIQFSIVLIDIDDFKSVNDIYGHDIGDYVLQTFASILTKQTRITDTVGRWGGEEFLIVCDNTDSKGAALIAEKLRKEIESTLLDKVQRKTISLGVAQFTDKDTINTLFKKADDALYKAKNSGKNRVVIAD